MKSKKHNKFAAQQGYQCAYSGKRLEDKFQLDHVNLISRGGIDLDFNIKACLTIVNHYKRALTLEEFREYMLTFHLRLAKLPKKTQNNKTKKRIEYMLKIAWAFNIEVDKPFDGRFHFEKFSTYIPSINHVHVKVESTLNDAFLKRYEKYTNKMFRLYWDNPCGELKAAVTDENHLYYENS